MMKRIMALIFGSILLVNFAAQAAPDAADMKWLGVVQKLIAKGETSIPTNSEQRVAMLKEWAGKKGYAVMVGKSDGGYHIELFPKVALK